MKRTYVQFKRRRPSAVVRAARFDSKAEHRGGYRLAFLAFEKAAGNFERRGNDS